MKIGILTRNYPPNHGGMSRHAQGLSQAIARHADVIIFAPSGAETDGKGVDIRTSLSINATENIELVREANVDVWFGLSANFAPLVKYSKVPFILYFHGNDFLYPIINPSNTFESRVGRIPWFWRYRSQLTSPFAEFLVRRRRSSVGRGARNAALVLFNSTFSQGLAETTYDLGNVRTEVLYPGCGDQFFQQRDRVFDGELRLLTVCNLVKSNSRKNIDGVLEALSLIGEKIRCLYSIIGSGDDQERLEEKACRLGLANIVNFTGSVSDDVLLRAYRDSDLFLLISKASELDVEGFGMVFIEANAAGLPVMASAKGGAVDAVVPGVTGIVIPDSSPKCIAEGILEFFEIRSSFKKDALRVHAEKFRWDRIGARFMELLKTIS